MGVGVTLQPQPLQGVGVALHPQPLQGVGVALQPQPLQGVGVALQPQPQGADVGVGVNVGVTVGVLVAVTVGFSGVDGTYLHPVKTKGIEVKKTTKNKIDKIFQRTFI